MTAYAVTGESAGFGGLGPWRYRTEIVEPPSSGQLRFNNADPTLATILWVHETNDDGVDMSNFLNLLTVGSLIYIQEQANADNYIIVEITTTTDDGTYVEYGINAVAEGGTVPSQNSKVSVVVGQSGAGQTTLQGAYNNSLGANPMILVNGTPDPISIRASVTGAVFDVEDVAGNIMFEVDADPDLIVARTGVTIEDSFTNGAATVGLTFSDTFTTGAGYLGGGILSNGTVTYNNSFFIWALLQESKQYNAAAGPGFAAFTLFNALAIIQNSGNFDLVQALILNNGVSHRRATAGTSVVTQNVGLSNSPNTRTNVSGAVMTKTSGDTAVRHAPTFATVAGSTVNLGTQIGLDCVNPAVALFQQQLGVENMTAYYGMRMINVTFGGVNRIVNVINTNLAAATNVRVINSTGNAASTHNGSFRFEADLAGNVYGASQDWSCGWAGAGFFFEQQNAPNPVGQFRKSFPSTSRMLMDWSVDMELTVNAQLGFSLGAQSGANGNQFGNFVAGAQSVTIGGEYSQFLLTQAGNVTADAALGGVFGWTINAPSSTLGTGTVTTAGALNVGGNVNQGSVNRFGVRILSNPSGGSGVNAALWVTAGLTRLDGRLDINQPIALGGGGTATLGTIGGSGPTGTAQAQWVEIDINGVAHWIPAWT